jgi:PAS domain S-box-containing protein
MRRLFKPPKFDDELKTNQAAMLHFVLWVSIALPIPYAIFMIFLAKENPWEVLGQSLTAVLFDFTLLVILHSGGVKLAAWLQSLVFWAFFSLLAATTSGVRGSAYLVGSGAVIVLAGALVGSRGATVVTILVCLTGGFLVYAEAQNILTFPAGRSPLSTWIISIMLFPIIAVVQNLASARLRRAFEQTHISEARSQAIVNALPDIIFRFSKDKTFLDYHAPGDQSLLVTPQQFINQPITRVLPPELAEITCQAIDRAFSTNRIQVYEYSLQSEDGTHYYEARMIASGEKETLAIVREITEQHQDKEEIKKLNEDLERRVLERTAQLQESEQRFRTLFENSPEGIFLIDPHHPDINWPIVDCNEVACRMNGYTRAELIGQSIDIVHPFAETHENRKNFFESFQREGQHVLEVIHRKKDGSLFPIETSINIVVMNGKEYVLGMDRDITERKRVEADLTQRTAQLQESEQRFRTLFENSPEGIILIDPNRPDIFWPILDCNEVTCNMTGFTHAELIGKPYNQLASTPYKPEQSKAFLEQLRQMRHIFGEFNRRRKDGSTYSIESSVSLLEINGKEFIMGIDRDITERKRVEATLAQQKNDLELANKELEAFSYSVSHDLRAPLRSISGFGKILQDDFSQSLDPLGMNYLSRMIESAVQLNELIDGMLKISRLSHIQLNPVWLDLSQLSDEIITTLRAQEPQRQVDVHIQAGLTALADPTLIRNVLENLLGNAWKYTSKKERAEIAFGSFRDEEKIVYYIRDNGAGFNMAYTGKLFSPFQRMHRSDEFPGYGIGLASVQRIIRKHNGKIWAEAEVEKGATFYFTLG